MNNSPMMWVKVIADVSLILGLLKSGAGERLSRRRSSHYTLSQGAESADPGSVVTEAMAVAQHRKLGVCDGNLGTQHDP